MLFPDEGYFFGMGAFETVALEEGRPVFLEAHYKRLNRAVDFLKLPVTMDEVREKVGETLEDPGLHTGRKALKITVSAKNLLVSARENPYGEKDYEEGFSVDFSCVRRNETSPFTYHKTLNYGDCIYEKRRASERGIRELVFLNTKGALAEGATSNLFFVKGERLYTPCVSCGILPGIVREYLLAQYPVEEREIYPEEIGTFDEMFLTNSLLGIMPVAVFKNRADAAADLPAVGSAGGKDGHRFASRRVTDRLKRWYQNVRELPGEITGM